MVDDKEAEFMKLFVFEKDHLKTHTTDERLAEHWEKMGAKLKGVYFFNDAIVSEIKNPLWRPNRVAKG
jgi:hypothetical protein